MHGNSFEGRWDLICAAEAPAWLCWWSWRWPQRVARDPSLQTGDTRSRWCCPSASPQSQTSWKWAQKMRKTASFVSISSNFEDLVPCKVLHILVADYDFEKKNKCACCKHLLAWRAIRTNPPEAWVHGQRHKDKRNHNIEVMESFLQTSHCSNQPYQTTKACKQAR